ncbi:HEAT repeat domain-containing protein [Anaerolineales bacterium HSG25]|nr:HEAT repeat domain-containing protein [Anaerolineales bacterium HSG25]
MIKQSKLRYQKGASDKVYEVDLCEVGPDQYVVNFRYGRYGTALRDGTKTVASLPLEQAQLVFDKLVTSKTKKRYQVVSAELSTAPTSSDPRAQAVLNRLHNALDPNVPLASIHWSLTRVIWRAGELKIKEATPLLLKLLGKGDKPLHDYCVVWSLGWCGDETVLPTLESLYRARRTPDMVRRISAEAMLKLGDEQANAIFRAELISQLPAELRTLTESGPAAEFAVALSAYLKPDQPEQIAVLDNLYRIDNEHVRPVLLDALATIPFEPNYFRAIRHIFKAAEYRHDGQVFGLIAYRIDKNGATFRKTYAPLSANRKNMWVRRRKGGYIKDAAKNIKSNTAKLAYGERTRTYFRRRVWRTMYKLGKLNDPAYVKMAVGVLAPYSDADSKASTSYFLGWDYENRKYVRLYWSKFANNWAFNHVLYLNSPRYAPKYKPLAWYCRLDRTQTPEPPTSREEAFPQLWKENPVGLLHLIAESDCLPVQEFAVLALRDCKAFCEGLDVEAVTMIVSRPYETTARLGFELALTRYQRYNPNHALVLALANCVIAEGRQQAHEWIDENRSRFIKDSDFIVAIVISPHADTRQFARTMLRSAIISDSVAQSLIARFVAYLIGLDSTQTEAAQDIAQTIQDSFSRQLRRIGLEIVFDLLAHPILAVQELGANILLNHDTRANDLPEGIITSLMESPHVSIRAVGLQLFGQLSDYTLLKQERLIVSFAMHALSDVRTAIRPVVQRLCRSNHRFSARLSGLFLTALLQLEPHDGVHSSLVTLLREDVGSAWLDDATPETVWTLLHAPSSTAHELGGHILQTKIERDSYWAEQITTEQIIELAEYEVAMVHQAAQAIFVSVINRFRSLTNSDHFSELAIAVRLLDGKWDDTRQFWFDTFREQLTAEDFSPGILVSICDSVRPDVQQFGRELITKYFAEDAGQEYLLKLSEHPTADLQLFATNFLERYAADNPARLAELQPYFVSVLARVNKARVAKDRVLNFLTVEAQKDVESARIVAQILERQSLTIAIGDKAKTIETMLAIQQIYPDITLPIQTKEPEVRYAV